MPKKSFKIICHLRGENWKETINMQMNKLLMGVGDLESCVDRPLSGDNSEGIFNLSANWLERGSQAGFPNTG